MNWDQIEGDWGRYKVSAKRRWNKLTEQQLSAIDGRRALLAGRIREAYSLSAEDTEQQVTVWQVSLAK